MHKLKAKARQADADARIAIEKQIEDLKAKQKTAQAKLDELRDASAEAWDQLKTGIEKAFQDLGDAFASAVEKFKK
jgi:hypothetical protein